MCTGAEALLLASAGATVGGSLLQNKAQNDAAERQRRAAFAEIERQEEFDKQRMANFQEALEGATPEAQGERLAEATRERQEAIDENVGVRPDASFESRAATGSPTVRVLQQALGREREAGDDFAAQLGNARARLGSINPALFGFNQELQDALFQQQELRRQGASSAQTGQLEAQQAGQPRGSTALAGNVLAGLGNVGMTAGARFGGANRIGDLFGRTPATPPASSFQNIF